jgi:hypothetical protein
MLILREKERERAREREREREREGERESMHHQQVASSASHPITNYYSSELVRNYRRNMVARAEYQQHWYIKLIFL